MKYDKHFLMSREEAKTYSVEAVHFFETTEGLTCEEIGDGNVNYVFRVADPKTGRSLIIKQSDTVFRSDGQPLDTRHNKAEAGILQVQGRLAPQYVPAVYRYDEAMCTLAMEDIGAYKNTRAAMLEGEIFLGYAHDMVDFLVGTLLPTTDLVLDTKEKKLLVEQFINPDMCEVSERLVLSVPFGGPNMNNVVSPGNEDFVRQNLYENTALQVQVAMLRERFMNYAQALIHGDLHSGSIFGNQNGLKVIDPEFAFYGPMGYDIGNVIGNLFFVLAHWHFTRQDNGRTVQWVRQTIKDIFDGFTEAFGKKYDELVIHPFYRADAFRRHYTAEVLADTLGYAGTEMIRRTVGRYKVAEIDTVAHGETRNAMERALILTAIDFIMERHTIADGSAVLARFDRHI